MLYYSDRVSELYCGGSENILKQFADRKFDLVVTSPPYDNMRTYSGFDWNTDSWKSIISELYRTVKIGGVVVWVVGDATLDGSETATSFKQALYFQNVGFRLHDTMIYLKDNPVPVGGSNRYYQAFEYMFVFSVGCPRVFNPILEHRRNKYNDKRIERHKSFNRNPDGSFPPNKKVSLIGEVKRTNCWKYVVGGGNSVEYGIEHPAAFPIELAYDHIRSWSNEGDLVLDPFVGSGTTMIAAKKLNRKSVGIDISQDYCEYVKKRLVTTTKPLVFRG